MGGGKMNYYPEPLWIKALPWIIIAQEVNKMQRKMYENSFFMNDYTYEQQWLAFLASTSKPVEWPFVRWFIEKHLLPIVIIDIVIDQLYHVPFLTPQKWLASQEIIRSALTN